jgi:DNA-binding response OmpR family regulator
MNNIYDLTLLIVDDEPELLDMVKDILLQNGFINVMTASNCRQARQLFNERNVDALILDVMLPDGDGFTLMQDFRSQSSIPILFLSARDEDENRLLGLGLGADDYITKPFLPRELILRLNMILRRVYFPTVLEYNKKTVFYLGEKKVDFDSGIITTKNNQHTLTAKEYALLKKLYDNSGNIVTVDSLCRAAWDDTLFGYENTLMVHIRRLREKIEPDPSHPKYLLTVRGLGYKLCLEDSK